MSERVKHSRRRKKRSILPVLALMLVLGASVGVTTAFLVTKTESITNVFEAGNTGIEVEETFNGVTKSDVYISNTGNVPVYIRVALILVWEDGDKNAVALNAELDTDLTITWGSEKWKKGSDGFWYYTEAVGANGITENLIDSAVVNTDSEGYQKGYQMNLQVMAQSIQAEPDEAVESAWKIVDANNGTLTVN